MLFQDPETQLVMSSVRAELALALESRGHGAAAVARGVEEVALALGIDALLDRSTHDALRRREAARRARRGARRAGRGCVLLDEPTSQLDPVAGDELIGLLRRLNQEWETTIVLAEHRLERCLAAADRVIALRATGASRCDGDPDAFLAVGRRATRRRCRRPARSCSRSPGLQPAAGGRQAGARDAARARPAGDEDGRARRSRRRPRPPSGAAAAGAPNGDARAALAVRGVWHELRDGPAILRGVDAARRSRARASR